MLHYFKITLVEHKCYKVYIRNNLTGRSNIFRNMKKKYALLGLILFLTVQSSVSARSTTTEEPASLVISTQESAVSAQNEVGGENEKDEGPVLPKIYQMRVDTNISNRYAKTLITSKVKNLSPKSQEATFSIVTPDKAFISGFVMEIDGKKYEAYVKEKEEAKKTYDEAVSSGFGAAHVAVSARDSNRFTVSVNVEPQSKATFYLTYEELLLRTSNKYELVLNIQPGQPVKDLDVVVNIAESRPLKFVKVPSLRSGNEISKNDSKIDPEADIKTVNETAAVVTFKPDIAKQKLLASGLGGEEKNGLSGQFVVEYDVVRDPQGGEVLVDGGYFVHFFAPEELTPIKKQIIFVLDTSGSMSGTRISQLKDAMKSILGELHPEDTLSIVEFSSEIKVWNIETERVTYKEGESPFWGGYNKPPVEKLDILPESVVASPENIKKATEVVNKLDAFGGTDILTALKVGLKVVGTNKNPQQNHPIIVFLTDGEPTVGEVSTEKIISTITELNSGQVPIFSLSFGDGADRAFLQKLSLKNEGFARHIYEAADANLQLENFYKQISSPLLTNVTFKYVDNNNVYNISKQKFPIFFAGSELYTTGIYDGSDFLPPGVEAWGINGPIILKPKVYQATGNLERLWAYMTVRQLLQQREVDKDKEPATQAVLKLALKYSFVTDVTSLVVVKPNETSAVNTEDAAKDTSRYPYSMNLPKSGVALKAGSPNSYPVSSLYSARSGITGRFAALGPSGFSGMPMYQFAAPQSIHASGFGGTSSAGLPGLAGYRTTPLYPRENFDITDISPTTTLAESSSLPWLKDVLNENGTITINEATYPLGQNETLGLGDTCTNSVNTTNGQCTLLHECKVIQSYLTDFATYKQHFCEIKGFAGVCCPLPQP
ncbi:inter-alpha-trypsin inhibitor heavy chain H4-like isoform X7 [Sitophilus oryzae]|uniref:Inter-alpha-trypsin inhibitor heavy chain H4-like isoform X7 n=1 Tax=Sitophilus oryzae TaxID=7048 RepID=A0A6J2Y9F3_SITOR|nr:inter-alpha-trypsin inhibitor heavy chain H4-like isoform X7 [Sitophilus oryzae]